jgi:hypothetical protein
VYRFAIRVAHDQAVNLGGRRQGPAKKVRQCWLAKLKAAAADGRRDEIALIDCSVKVFTQRSLLGGKPARDKTRGVFPHYVTVGDPIDDQNRPNRKQDEDTDAHDERRQQPEGGLILRQMILAAMLSLDAMVAQLGYEFHYGNQRSRYRNRLVGEQA